MRADDKCFHCGRDFADHDYVKDSITRWTCPVLSQESIYGFFHGGDPREFYPDAESCSESELANHRRACDLWNQMESKGKEPTPEDCPSGWLCDEDGKRLVHVLRSPYGIGVSVIRYETEFELLEPVNKIEGF